jgi:hypothetical protein
MRGLEWRVIIGIIAVFSHNSACWSTLPFAYQGIGGMEGGGGGEAHEWLQSNLFPRRRRFGAHHNRTAIAPKSWGTQNIGRDRKGGREDGQTRMAINIHPFIHSLIR